MEAYLEMYEAEKRIAACGCGGACESCKRDRELITYDDAEKMAEYEAWLDANGLR